MKAIAYNIILLVFSSIGVLADIGSTSTNDFANEKVNCEAYCPDYEDDALTTSNHGESSASAPVICDNDEPYVDDIPFDTSEVIENIDLDEMNNGNDAKQEKEITIFQLFIKWVSLLFQVE